MSEQAPRPGQATFAGWLIIGGSVIVVLTAWERISGLGSMETQAELRRVLGRPPFDGMGLTLSSLQTTIKVACMVAAGSATASAILGVEALRRSRQARLVLSLLAPLVLVGGFATAGLFGSFVAAGVAMLWLQPSRNWFAGLPLPEPPSPPRMLERRLSQDKQVEATAKPEQTEKTREEAPPVLPAAQPAAPATPEQPGGPTDQRPGPYAGFGAPLPSPYGPPRPGSRHGRRPTALIWACVLVWVSTAVVAGAMALMALVIAVMRDDLFAELERQQVSLSDFGLTQDQFVTGTYVMTAVVLPWCLAAAVLAILALRRVRWARFLLVVSAGAAAVIMLPLVVANPFLVLLVAAAVATVVLLLRREVTAWFNG